MTPVYPVVAERETHWGQRLKTQAMETGKKCDHIQMLEEHVSHDGPL